ncbi:MAG: thioredoxin domain-containing protein [Candidatus Palauibacterales bacterium]|nr:thioredoxin domain-containing protein [Candidatus Palauibacterales bacterium]
MTPPDRSADADPDGRNRLAREKSPYLLQHADNPVDWYPWGEEAFEKARREDRPIFLSIGYSTCHWCHVMEEESFEDEEVADLLNETVVPVKVDREERPDVDNFFMSVCQAMTGRGGWPLNVLLTPDGKPFFAGTYLPKESQRGRMGLMQLVSRVGDLWENERERVLTSGDQILDALEQQERRRPGGELSADVLESAYGQLASRFDEAMGGFGQAPKFPSPHNLLFLLRHHDRTGEERALEMVTTTLRRIRMGGIRDHLGGGFHRYSTDARWLLPHFEKMLYDQATLALAFTETFQVTGDEEFADAVDEIHRYVSRDLSSPEGGFYSAEDADSEGEEGTFYVWRTEELKELLGEDRYDLIRRVYGVREAGNYAEEATGERTGANILHLQRPLDETLAEIADERDASAGELEGRLVEARETLFEAREERPRPGLDDKVLTDWNGLMIGALARGGAALDRPEMIEDAREAAEFVLEALREDGGGRLLHRYRDGEAAVPAQAADYAFLVFGLLELYAATFELRWLEEAVRLEEEARERCWDGESGGYFVTGEDASELPVRQKEAHDGALPSANSVALWNLRRLGRMTGDRAYDERAAELEAAFSAQVRKSPSAHTQMLVGVEFRVGPGHEVVLAGADDAPGMDEMTDLLRCPFRPRTVCLRRPAAGEEVERLASLAPFTRDQEPASGGQATAYVCRDFACEAPTTDPDDLRRQLGG